MKSYNKFYESISIAKDLSSEDMFKITDIVEIQEQSECVSKKIVSNRKESTENINDRSEKNLLQLKIHWTGTDITNHENVNIAPG